MIHGQLSNIDQVENSNDSDRQEHCVEYDVHPDGCNKPFLMRKIASINVLLDDWQDDPYKKRDEWLRISWLSFTRQG